MCVSWFPVRSRCTVTCSPFSVFSFPFRLFFMPSCISPLVLLFKTQHIIEYMSVPAARFPASCLLQKRHCPRHQPLLHHRVARRLGCFPPLSRCVLLPLYPVLDPFPVSLSFLFSSRSCLQLPRVCRVFLSTIHRLHRVSVSSASGFPL